MLILFHLNFKAFSCSEKSMFRLDSKQCERGVIFPAPLPPVPPDTAEWKPVTECISMPCLIPAKGIHIISRTCDEDHINKNAKTTAIFEEKEYRKCKGVQTHLQICSDDYDKDRCSKLVTPSQFASTRCSVYQSNGLYSFSGIGVQLKSNLIDPNRPCKVACQDKFAAHRYYIISNKSGWFPNGMACEFTNDEPTSYCVMGRCMKFDKGLNKISLMKKEAQQVIEDLLIRDMEKANKQSMKEDESLWIEIPSSHQKKIERFRKVIKKRRPRRHTMSALKKSKNSKKKIGGDIHEEQIIYSNATIIFPDDLLFIPNDILEMETSNFHDKTEKEWTIPQKLFDFGSKTNQSQRIGHLFIFQYITLWLLTLLYYDTAINLSFTRYDYI